MEETTGSKEAEVIPKGWEMARNFREDFGWQFSKNHLLLFNVQLWMKLFQNLRKGSRRSVLLSSSVIQSAMVKSLLRWLPKRKSDNYWCCDRGGVVRSGMRSLFWRLFLQLC